MKKGSSPINIENDDLKPVYVPIEGPKKVIVCIPAYREEEHIAKVVVSAKKFADQVLVCDDASDDSTYEIAEALGAIVMKHDQSLGYSASLTTLFKNARKSKADFIITIDCDGQYDPSEIPVLLDRLIKGDVDVVIGSRFLGGKGTEARRVNLKVQPSKESQLTDAQSGFRAFTAKALDTYYLTDSGIVFNFNLWTNARSAGLKIAEVPIHSKYDVEPPIKKSKGVGLGGILDPIKSLSIRHPLLLFGAPGVLAVLVGLGLGVFMLRTFFSSGYLSTNMILLGVASISIGVILVATSILLWVLPSKPRAKA